MRIFHQNEILEPLKTKYIGDEDLTFKSKTIYTQDGFYFQDEEYLKNAKSQQINNYSNFILTNKVLNDNIFDLKRLSYRTYGIFCTTLKFSNQKYLKINLSSDMSVSSGAPVFSEIADKYTTFEVNFVTDELCYVYYVDGFDAYYLAYNSSNFYFTKIYDFDRTIFNYIKNKNTLYLFKNKKSVSVVADTLSSSNDFYIKNPISINFYLQDFDFTGNTSWASYEKINKNDLLINPEKSITDLSNNILIYNQYTYISGFDIEANFLTLKNQHTNKNYSYRADNLNNKNINIPNVDIREYNSLDTGLNQELGFESIALTYDIYNNDYIFKADRYTPFKIPSTSYPFERLNINDSQLFKNGSIAGNTPYHSDKLFFKDIQTGISNDKKYLCTWLSGSDKNALWVDRYYYPEKTPFSSLLSTAPGVTFLEKIEEYLNTTLAPSAYYENFFWQSLSADELASTPQKIKDAIWGEVFFDKASDVVLMPEQEYVYHRLGEKYAEQIVNALSASLIADGLLPHRRYDGFEFIYDENSGDITYNFTGNEYSLIDNYRKINFTNEFTLAYTMNSYNWQEGFGHEIMGSFNDRGFGVFSDEKITPFIMVQEGRSVIIYNTAFEKIDAVYLSQDELDMQVLSSQKNEENIAVTTTFNVTSFAVKDVIRTDHLNYFLPTIKNYTYSEVKRDDVVIRKSECGILYTDEKTTSRILSPNNVFIDDMTQVEKIQIEQCKFKSRYKKK